MFYVVARSIGLIKKDPARMLKVFQKSGWQSFREILKEASRARKKAKLSPDERAKLSRERRKNRFESGTWRHEGDVSRRRYDSYEDYLQHQKSKLSRERVFANLTEKYDERVASFCKHFGIITEIAPHSSILCLAARLGHEVKAFISLGHFAVGIDLNPGQQNSYVVTGDFHSLVFGNDSVDCVYTNSLDHAFDIGKIASEVRRVLKPGGHFIVELFPGYKEGFIAGDFEAMHWADAKAFAEKIRSAGEFAMVASCDLTPFGFTGGLQCVMQKRPVS